MTDLRFANQDYRPIIATPVWDRLCSDNDQENLNNAKLATVDMIITSLSPCLGRLVYGSLVYPEKYHHHNLTTDFHHLLRQVFQRSQPLSWKDPQLKRVFFDEVKDGEGAHGHFLMETPREMTVPDFAQLLEARWKGIATRTQRHAKHMQRLKEAPKYSPRQPKTIIIKDKKLNIEHIPSTAEIDFQTLAGNPQWEGLAKVKPVETLEDLTKYSLKWMNSNDPRFSSDLMLGGSKPTLRGHRTELVLL